LHNATFCKDRWDPPAPPSQIRQCIPSRSEGGPPAPHPAVTRRGYRPAAGTATDGTHPISDEGKGRRGELGTDRWPHSWGRGQRDEQTTDKVNTPPSHRRRRNLRTARGSRHSLAKSHQQSNTTSALPPPPVPAAGRASSSRRRRSTRASTAAAAAGCPGRTGSRWPQAPSIPHGPGQIFAPAPGVGCKDLTGSVGYCVVDIWMLCCWVRLAVGAEWRYI